MNEDREHLYRAPQPGVSSHRNEMGELPMDTPGCMSEADQRRMRPRTTAANNVGAVNRSPLPGPAES